MEAIVAKLLQQFEEGKMNRRQLVHGLAVAAAAMGASAPAAGAAELGSLKVAGIHHISYQVKDYARSRDLYSSLFGWKVANDNGKQCQLMAGEVELIVRNGTGTTPQVDHIAYAIENWNNDAVTAVLKGHGLDPKPEGDNSFQFRDPDGYHVQLMKKS